MSKRDLWTMTLLGLACLFLFADQNLLAPNLTAIADEFGFDAVERDVKLGGDIALIFWMLGGVVAMAVGVMTDRLPRKPLFVAVVLVGELPCFLTGFVETYEQLYWLRALTGIGIGGALPLAFSLLGDLFGARSRGTAVAVIGFAMGLGIAIGQLIAGFVGPEHGWRLPFMIVAAPNFLIGLLFAFTVREPERGRTEEALKDRLAEGEVYGARIDLSKVGEIFRTPTNLLIFLQGIPGTVPWGVFFVFLNDFYAQEKGYTVQEATLIVMAIGGAAIVGGLVGGILGGWLYNRSPRLLPLLAGGSTLVGIVPTALLLSWPGGSFTVPLILAVLTGFTITITGPCVRTMLLDVNAPETRGTAFALYNLADDLGKGLGPAIIAVLIASFGRLTAFHVANLFWVFCGIALLVSMRYFPRDEAALQERLATRS
ncbi:MAG: MFS transporter [Deltaproteobacteria bacterium]|nr:MFS transporter [Deltaproteobacteria bacterium]MBW2253814.1 MFS transporter [Deltaproteobacteria bacterium]